MTFELGTGIFTQKETSREKDHGDTFEEFVCKAGDTLTMHVSQSKLVHMTETTVSFSFLCPRRLLTDRTLCFWVVCHSENMLYG
jgi:hypothetical protein